MSDISTSTQDPGVDLDTALDAVLTPTPETALETEPSPPSTDGQASGDTPDPAASQARPDDAAPPAAHKAPDTPSVDLSTYSPPPGGTPFTFRVDRSPVAPEGALSFPTGKWIPNEAWDRQILPHLANRAAWQQERGSLHQRASESEGRYKALEAQHNAIMAEVDKIFSGDQAAAEGFFQNWQLDGPRLRAEMEARATRAQLDEYRRRESDIAQADQRAQYEREMPVMMGDTIAEWLEAEGVPVQSDQDKQRWAQWVLNTVEDYGLNALFLRGPAGQPVLNEEKVERLFKRELAATRHAATTAKVVDRKQALNTAAVAPSKPKPPGPGKVVPRQPDGTFARQADKKAPVDFDELVDKTSFF